MENDLKVLIRKYENLLAKGESFVLELNSPGQVKEKTPTSRCQKGINAIWRIIIKDLQQLAEKLDHDFTKKRD